MDPVLLGAAFALFCGLFFYLAVRASHGGVGGTSNAYAALEANSKICSAHEVFRLYVHDAVSASVDGSSDHERDSLRLAQGQAARLIKMIEDYERSFGKNRTEEKQMIEFSMSKLLDVVEAKERLNRIACGATLESQATQQEGSYDE